MVSLGRAVWSLVSLGRAVWSMVSLGRAIWLVVSLKRYHILYKLKCCEREESFQKLLDIEHNVNEL